MAGGKELRLAISIGGKIDKSLGSAINNAQAQLGKIGNIANTVGMAATAAVVAGTTKIIHDSVQAYTEYESALNSAAATAGVEKGSAAYEQMNAAAREAGANTVKTAKESAQALEYMALAGWSVEDSTKALTPILKLSAAAGMELATTSDLVTDTMAGMGLGINDLGRYLDVLSKANNSANHNSQQLLESYIGAGAVLRNLNVPIEKSAAVLGVMANQGLKGSEAGTALNAILVNMQKKSGDSYKAMSKLGVSMYDSAGNARDLLQVFQDVHDKTASMTEEQRNLMYQMIGGKAHLADFAMIMNGFTASTETGTAQVYDLEKAYNGAQGTLDKFYDIKTDTLEGSITRLNSAYEGMLLNIGERLAPTVSTAVNNLVNKMPQIENAIMSFLNTIIPAGTAAIDLLTRNPDKVIQTVTGIAKAFLLFKGIKGLADIGMFVKDLVALGKFAGLPALFNGMTGALTGVSGGFAAIAGAALPVIGVLAAIAAAVGIGVVAYKAWDKAQNHWGDTTLEQAKALHETASKYKELGALQKELSGLEFTIHNPNATAEETEAARSRIQEIADLLAQEYNLKINTDTAGLDEAVSKVESAVKLLGSERRREFNDQWGGYMDTMADTANKYADATANAPGLQRDLNVADFNATTASNLYSDLHDLQTTHAGGGKDSDYIKAVNEIYNRERGGALADAIKNQYSFEMPEQITNTKQADDFVGALYGVDRAMGKTLDTAQKAVDTNNTQRAAWLEAQQNAATAVSEMLMTDVMQQNAGAIEQDISKFESLAKKMRDVGESTAGLETQFAAASAGYETFDAAAAEIKAADMAENLLKFKVNLGDTAEMAVSSAALVANGFENVEKATAAGASGIDSVIASMKQMGDTHRLFSGLDNAGIADKLSDMAHAINLIPENKTITVDAQGNFSVIEDAQNQIASLKSIGNVDVSVTASGDFSVINEATGEIQTLQGMGAVSLQVNAEGNIDVLDKAQQVIATIDSKNAQINVNGQVAGLGDVEKAKAAADGIQSKTGTIQITGTFAGSAEVEKAVDYQGRLKNINTSQTITGSFPGKSDVATAISYQGQLQNKSVTYTVTYKQVGTPPGHNAAGTPSWRGGLTYLNDQPGISDPREVVEYNGQRYWFGGRNVLADVPQGARIYNAAQSRGMIDESEADDYRTGSGAFGRAIDRLRYTRSEGGASSGGESGGMNVTYSPNIVIEGNADEAAISRALRSGYDDFTEYMDRYNREQRRKSFGVA